MDTAQVQISAEVTPNPNTLKFNISRPLVKSGTMNFTDKTQAKGSLLAEKLFEIESVIGVMIGRDFVTITKTPMTAWQGIVEPITATLKELLNSGKVLFADVAAPASHAAGDDEIVTKIKQILDDEIRPAVNMDGGDITFHGYYDGVVTLHLQGSCSSCPSSIMTLKMGVENRLKAVIPEIKEVVQV